MILGQKQGVPSYDPVSDLWFWYGKLITKINSDLLIIGKALLLHA